MAVCCGSGYIDELTFVRSLHGRKAGDCRGPLVELVFEPGRFSDVEDVLTSTAAIGLLWSGFRPFANPSGLTFRLCAMHWLDLTGVLMAEAVAGQRSQLTIQTAALVRSIVETCGWDLREISNMLRWQRIVSG